MGDVAVSVDGVWKQFVRGERHDSLRDLVPALLRRTRTTQSEVSTSSNDFWAIRDVSYNVRFGEAFGIIGPNGAGKSTMLKLLMGILRPNRGEIRMRGRVASLIEVSAGFHQDLTGRENVYLQGAVLGMSRREVQQRLDSIVDFAGIEAFIDTPVKRYSSGMNARLGFSVAVHLEPDVLVLDEVLSVGDMLFQQRCVNRMKAFKRDGVAIVFVSHNMQAIGELCDSALVLQGAPRYIGPVGQAVGEYLRLVGTSHAGHEGNGVVIRSTRLENAAGDLVDGVVPHERLRLVADVEVQEDMRNVSFCIVVRRSTDGETVYDGGFPIEQMGLTQLDGGTRFTLAFDFAAHLVRGQYDVGVNVYDHKLFQHRAFVATTGTFRVDEQMSYGGTAGLDVQPTLRPAAALAV